MDNRLHVDACLKPSFEDEAMCNLRRHEGQRVSSYLSNFNKLQLGSEI